MLISHAHRFIYTKTFKTAGTSVEAYLEPLCMAPGAWSPSHERDACESAHGVIGYRGPLPTAGMRWWNHMPAAAIRAQAGEATWNAYFKFCVVRHPYERAISAFYFAREKGRLPPSDAPDPVQIERWLAAGGLRMDRDAYLVDGVFALDAVLRHEHLHDDLAALCGHLGVPWEPGRLPRFKAGLRPGGATADAVLTPRSRAWLHAHCALEFELFEYGLETA